ncbi:MAG: hypothetical protein NC131_18600 [Roseburia sp.]|nr:hypothetical protein [Roseburia sp.]
MARPIIDFEVERRHMSHAKLYNDIISIPAYQQDTIQSMEVVRLSKAFKKKEPMTFLECLLLTNSITPDDRDAECEFITSVKKYDLSADALAEIKSMLVCTISVSEEISKGITDACVDFASGDGRRAKKGEGLYVVLYNESYDRLESLCGKEDVFDAASIMGGD